MWDWIVQHKDNIGETVRSIVEIVILWVLIYQIYRFFRSTRGAQILMGLLISLVGIILLTYLLHLTVIGFLLIRILAPILGVALVVIFQPELRSGLAKLGSHPLLSRFMKIQQTNFLDVFCKSLTQLSNKRYGALFAFQKNISLKNWADTGVPMDSLFTQELALTIFFPKTALHDGGVILSSDRIVSAACVFPVSSREMSDRSLGLRHRAAVGLSDETDSVVVIVSEETGAISISYAGKLERHLDGDALKERLRELLRYSTSENEQEMDR